MCFQPGTEHSTRSLNLFQPVSYHASVTLFTHNYILAPLSVFSFSFPALDSQFSHSSQKESRVALRHQKAARNQHFSSKCPVLLKRAKHDHVEKNRLSIGQKRIILEEIKIFHGAQNKGV